MNIFVRSLLLQACWSFEGMQNVGFLFSLDPLLRRAHRAPERYREAVLRHLEHFNTHPYMAGVVLGAVGSMEERRSAAVGATLEKSNERIAQMKKYLSTAMAAVGDSFFWGALRPACAAWTMAFWLILWTLRVPHPVFFGAVFYLVAFNVPALWARWRGIQLGCGRPEEIVAALEGFRWQTKALWIRRAGLTAAWLILAVSWLVPPLGGAASWVGVVVFAAASGLRAAGVTCSKTYAGAIALGSLVALVGL